MKKHFERHPEIDKLLNEIAAYRLKTQLGRTQFGLIVANDGHFIKRLETGRMPRIPTIERVREIMARKAVKAKGARATSGPRKRSRCSAGCARTRPQATATLPPPCRRSSASSSPRTPVSARH